MSLWVSCKDCYHAYLCPCCEVPVYCLAEKDFIADPMVEFHVPDDCEAFEPRDGLFDEPDDSDELYERWKDERY